MSNEEAKQIISNIDKVFRNFTVDEYKALNMAIKALSQMERRESKDVIDPYDMKYIRCGKGVII